MTAPPPRSSSGPDHVARRLHRSVTEHAGLKAMALVLALLLWIAVAARTGRLRVPPPAPESVR